MSDLTILYYTANTIPESTGKKVRDYLLKVTDNQYPIISVSQKPINFGQNICVGEIGRSKYNCYKQILIGIKEVKTKYVACAEDDTLYSADHFLLQPKDEFFYYETNMWFAQKHYFWRMENTNRRSGMWGCVCLTKALLENLTARYSLFPIDPLGGGSHVVWGEPGVKDSQFGMKNRIKFFASENPTVVFLYRNSMGGKHIMGRYKIHKPENMAYNLKYFGGVRKLWKSYWP